MNDGSIVKLIIKDTAGQERFDSINERFYKDADCCLLVYDITNQASFEKIKNYYVKTIEENCKSYIKVILLGNKTDLEEKRKITLEEGIDLAFENNYMFMESSCSENYNVSDAFTALIEMTNHVHKTDNDIEAFSIKKVKPKKEIKFC